MGKREGEREQEQFFFSSLSYSIFVCIIYLGTPVIPVNSSQYSFLIFLLGGREGSFIRMHQYPHSASVPIPDLSTLLIYIKYVPIQRSR